MSHGCGDVLKNSCRSGYQEKTNAKKVSTFYEAACSNLYQKKP